MRMVTRRFVSSFTQSLALAPFLAIAMGLALVTSASAQEVELLDFYLPTCGPCRAMAPTVERLEAEGVRVRRVDGSRETQLAAQLRVDSYPTFVAVANGREVGRIVGATQYESLKQLVSGASQQQQQQPAAAPQHTFAPVSGRENSYAMANREFGAQQPAVAGPVPSDHAKLLSTTVRFTILEPNGRSFGTGTIIDARSGEALVVTCAHLFRGPDGKPIDPAGKISIELFDTATGAVRVSEKVEGQLISHDFDADVALVAIRPSVAVPSSRVAMSPGDLQVGAPARSVGCDLGADPTVCESQIVDLNRYDGPPNIEAAGAPIQGRSGGGLFNAAGELIGVCNFADEPAGEGIYAGLASVHAQLDRIGLTNLYRNPAATPAADASLVAASQPAAQPAAPSAVPSFASASRDLTPVERTPIIRGQNAIGAPDEAALTTGERATLSEIVSRGEKSEVVVLIRADEPGGRTEVLTLDAASPEFVATLRRLGAK
jgi:thiol-disulfide isomerase/thioredoxin